MHINYEQYYDNALTLNPAEEALQEVLLPQLPDLLIDSHAHAAEAGHFDINNTPPHVQNHMMSTFPVTTVEQSQHIDQVLTPGLEVRKLRFAHAFTGIAHRAVNKYLLETSPSKDKVALFGLSNSEADIAYTIAEIESGSYSGLKMYYNASNPPKSELFDYFPPAILGVAEKNNLPIILHLPHSIYKSHNEVESLAEQYPSLKIVLAHIGVAHVVKPELDKILQSLSESDNIYVDTSGVDNPDLVRKAVTYLDDRHVLYGSDEPLNLIRAVVYDNPTLGPRLLTDYDYHWADEKEQHEWRHLAQDSFVHSEWRQLEAILDAANSLNVPPQTHTRILENIFSCNAKRVFGFKD